MAATVETISGTNIGIIKPPEVDPVSLANDLKAVIKGEVRFDPGSRALYATDGSNYRQVPIGVVVPRDIEDVIQTVALCRLYSAPVLPRGCGTSLAGQCCNVAVVMDMSKYMHNILDLDPVRRRARIQPGLVLDDLRDAAEQHHLTFAPDPSTHSHCTLGGMMGNNSCGVHSVMGGKTEENVEELDILTYDGVRMTVGKTRPEELEAIIREGGRRGEIYAGLKSLADKYADLIRARYPKIPRRVSGYNLPSLLPENGFDVAKALVGSEGTCVTILEAVLRLVYSPPSRSLLVLAYPDVYTAADQVPEVLEYGPTGLEGLDDVLIDNMKKLRIHPHDLQLIPEGGGWLLVEFGGETKEESDAKARRLMDDFRSKPNPPAMKLFDDKTHEKMVWKVRQSGLGATARVPGEKETWEGWEDSAVPPERAGDYLRDLRKLFNKYNYKCALYGHFGQGCIHTRIDFELQTKEGIKQYRSFINDAADLVVSYGGSLSGEHGDGQSRAEMLPKMFGMELIQAFREFKSLWDPDWKMNPGKVVDAYRISDNLRLGTSYRHPHIETHFRYPEDDGDFTKVTTRCVGIGDCRKTSDGTMCPSYMVTREEKHSTRGRAHLLFEMIQGDPSRGGWHNEDVREALDLCLSCKGCKGECPVQVDMATYKAEFLSHYYDGRLRPIHAYAFGLIDKWAALASYMPRVANVFSQTPVLRTLGKAAIGVAQQRRLPPFASYTFQNWFRKRPLRNGGRPKVMLWPDTFNNYFHPETAEAAVDVLEEAGYQVIVPETHVCCGRPLYDYGMLDTAKKYIQRTLDRIRPVIRADIPIVGLEPSCVSVFHDELSKLYGDDEDAKRLVQNTYNLSQFLQYQVKDYRPPKLERKALVHGHCHHKAVEKMDAENLLLTKLGLDFKVVDSGCCGMAGAFGFEKDHYEVSIKAGERVLLPAVRKADMDTLIVADGFSCRTQISETTGRHALHIAQVIQMAMKEGPRGPAGPFPESRYLPPQAQPSRALQAAVLIGVGAAMAGAIYLHRRNRGSKRWLKF